jgi:hypothetical protein
MINPNPTLRRILPIVMLILIVFGLALTGGHSEEEATANTDGAAIKTKMTQARLEEIISAMATETDGEPGWLNFLFDRVPMVCVTDVNADRMRITAPIARIDGLDGKQLIIAMEANFHSVLDARYATSNGLLHAVYIHPLSSLTEDQVRSAIVQVAIARQTFGSTYTSGLFKFRGTPP